MTKLEQALNRWLQLVAEAYKDKAPVSSGGFKDSIAPGEVVFSKGTYEVFILADEIYKFIEDGRLSGSWAPPENILEWVKIKPIIPQPYTLPNGNVKTPTENQVAFMINRKIFKDGTPPNPILLETLQEHEQKLYELIAEALAEDVLSQLMIELNK